VAGADELARRAFDTSLPAHARRNRAWWDADSERYQAVVGQQLHDSGGAAWGVWQIPEAELHVLGDVSGRTTVELGCGAAQWSIALAAAGAIAIGVDLSEVQLRAAWAACREAGVEVRLVHASAESLPLPDASVDIAFCDWGASRFADPDRWIPEAARILKPGGLLAFSTATPLLDLCWLDSADAPETRLLRDAFGLDRVVDDGRTVEFQRTDGDWIRSFRRAGLAIEDLIELRPPEGAVSSYWDEVAYAWARRWPAEQIWRLRREP
jgi:SAM-dependent methyltransferase